MMPAARTAGLESTDPTVDDPHEAARPRLAVHHRGVPGLRDRDQPLLRGNQRAPFGPLELIGESRDRRHYPNTLISIRTSSPCG
jgi:hypothetical protein